MFGIIRNKIATFKANQRKLKFRCGYDYAAGELLRNPTKQTVKTLQGHVDSSHAFHEFDEFDEGIVKALRDWASKVGPIS